MFKKIAILGAVCLSAVTAHATEVRYPYEEGRERTKEFAYQVLDLALSKADGDWTLVPSAQHMNEKRQRNMLAAGREIDVAWYGTSAELEQKLRPVRIPIDGGLVGWRLMLIDEARQADFSAVSSIEDLRKLVIGQGAGWADVPILEAAGLEVATSDYNNLFRMVGGGRIDAFPRGANEAFREQANFVGQVPNLAVEKDLVVYYPLTVLFFVSPGNDALHDAIHQGLVRAHEDGSYQQLFSSHPEIKTVLDQANLGSRTKIELPNPTMSPETTAIDPKYWYAPNS